MKSSTRKNSSDRISNVKGILFFRSDYSPKFITVESWEKAGKPGDCFVYDGAHQLLAAGIPIVDATELEGRWVRTPIPAKCPDTIYRKHPSNPRSRVRTSTIPLKTFDFITSEGTQSRKLR